MTYYLNTGENEDMLRFLPAVFLLAILSSILFIPAPTPKKVAIGLDTTTSCCKVEDVLNSTGAFDPQATAAIFNSQAVDYPKEYLANLQTQDQNQAVLGTTNSAGEEKWIEVNLSQQKLTAWEGNKLVEQYLISSGRWFPTPVGTYYIWYKTRYQSMVGGSPALGTYYNLPNVPNNMFFHQGFAIHGAYWHNNFGNPMSHGCVNEPLDKAAWIFNWAGPVVPPGQNVARATPDNPGTKVVIHS